MCVLLIAALLPDANIKDKIRCYVANVKLHVLNCYIPATIPRSSSSASSTLGGVAARLNFAITNMQWGIF